MATDLTVVLDNKPGTLAQFGEVFGKAGINLDGGFGFPSAGKGEIHFVVEDAAAAKKLLNGAGIKVSGERPVLLATIADRPGELGKLARRIADAGVNIEMFYLTSKGKLVLGVDNLEKARKALG